MTDQTPDTSTLGLADRAAALAAAEAELEEARIQLEQAWPKGDPEAEAAALDRHMLALVERNAIRDGTP